ncbi:MAG: ABC transporter permease [Actinomycetota bacterium]|nr:ABC transporter permease [Actinomycetota bacterium]
MNVKEINKKAISFNIVDYVIYFIFFGIFILFAVVLFNRGFLTFQNLMNITRQTSTIAIMATGMVFVLCTGEIDLSIGSTVSLCSIVSAILLRDFNIYISILSAVLLGLLIGLINGLLVTKVKIPSFLVTLGMMSILLGLARWISDIKPIPVTNKAFIFLFGLGTLGKIPVIFLWTVLVAVIGHLILTKTPFGRKITATGGNILAAKYTGIKTDNMKIAALVISGVLAALAALIYAGRLQGARYTLGQDDAMIVIASAVIGGTSLSGGKGTVIGGAIGAFILIMINNGILLLGLSVDQQIIARGIIIILSVSFGIKRGT